MIKTPGKSWALTTTFVGLVCGLVLTQNKLYADTVTTTPVQTPIANVQKATDSQYTDSITKATNGNATPQAAPVTNTTSATDENTQKSQSATQDSKANAAVTDQPALTNQTSDTTIPQSEDGSPQSETTPVATDQPVTQNSGETTQSTVSNKTTTQSQQSAAQAATDPTQNTETLIANGQSGTAKWDYVKNNTTGEYVLKIHAGQLSSKQISQWIYKYNYGYIYILQNQLNKIIIDPDVYTPQNSSYLFSGLNRLETIEGLTNLQVQYTQSMYKMFADDPLLNDVDLSFWSAYRVTDMGYMFYNDSHLTNVNLDYLETGKVISMQGMFYGTGITDIDLSTLDFSNVQYMDHMFTNSQLQTIDLSYLSFPEVTDMSYMFSGSNLKTINLRSIS